MELQSLQVIEFLPNFEPKSAERHTIYISLSIYRYRKTVDNGGNTQTTKTVPLNSKNQKSLWLKFIQMQSKKPMLYYKN
jgi:hypothetical protein